MACVMAAFLTPEDMLLRASRLNRRFAVICAADYEWQAHFLELFRPHILPDCAVTVLSGFKQLYARGDNSRVCVVDGAVVLCRDLAGTFGSAAWHRHDAYSPSWRWWPATG